MSIAVRLLAGAVAATAIAAAARRAGSLDGSGAVAAAILGTLATAAGWSWGIMLVAYFLVASLLSRFRATAKETRAAGRVAKGGRRDAWQVVANGGVFGVAALVTVAGGGSAPWSAAAAGALAASTADTWATELGMLARRAPRSIISWREVPPGTSGAISAPGLVATLAGAGFIAALAMVLGWGSDVAVAAVAGGIVGSLLDSLAGATLQDRRRCPACDVATERRVHSCGTMTEHVGGLRVIDNDMVNAIATLAGAATGALALALAVAVG